MTPNDRQPFEELLSADEGPMRRELMRQIAALELKLSKLRRDQAPYEQLPELLERGPALLSTEQLEQVRDELLETIEVLQRRVARRAADGISDPAVAFAESVDAPPAHEGPFRRLLRRLRRASRDLHDR